MAEFFLVRTLCQLEWDEFFVPPDHVCWARWVRSAADEERHVQTYLPAALNTRHDGRTHNGYIWIEVGPECVLLTPMEVLLLPVVPTLTEPT